MGAGTSRAYTLARLRRDDPDMALRVEAGELSANAAAVAKGWRKPPDVLQQLKRLWDKASPDERASFEAFKLAAPPGRCCGSALAPCVNGAKASTVTP